MIVRGYRVGINRGGVIGPVMIKREHLRDHCNLEMSEEAHIEFPIPQNRQRFVKGTQCVPSGSSEEKTDGRKGIFFQNPPEPEGLQTIREWVA